jgi:hypothetical protein
MKVYSNNDAELTSYDNLEKIVLGEFFATPIARIGQYLKW